MIIRREWAMPSRHTFTIQPIKELIYKYGGDFKGWVDPFAGENSPAEITNDLNPEKPTKFHMAAAEFAESLTGIYNGVLYDPPYSTSQLKECYENVGMKTTFENCEAGVWQTPKKIIAPKIMPGGIAICCGWNSTGFGKYNGFELIEILLVAHGGMHNDTIITVERKFKIEMF